MAMRGKGGTVVVCVAVACVAIGVHVVSWRLGPKLALGQLPRRMFQAVNGPAHRTSDAAPPQQPQLFPQPGPPAPVAPGPAAPGLAPDQLFALCAPAVALVEVRDARNKTLGLGSGFFVDPDGMLVTNFHVIESGVYASVRTADGRTLQVEGVLAVDPTCDLALLKVMANYMPCLDVSTTSVPPTGTRVFAIGNPQGLSNTLSDGLVSGVRLDPHGMNVIQTTAAISPGSSGGPLLTADGTVVGVTTFQSSSGQNLNFAIPAERVHPLIKARGPLRKLATLKAMTPAPSANSDALLAALAALNRGDVRGASELLERADDRQRSIPRYWYVSGLLHTKLNNLPRAADAFKEATRLKADYVEAWERLADIYIIQGKHREAIDAFREIARARPLDTRAYHRAAHVHSWLREYDKALSLLDRALSINPRDGMAHAEKAICYMSVKRYDEAVASAEAALAIDRRLFVAHNVIGETRLLQKRYPEAVTALREALKIAPSSPDTYVLLGEACHRGGDSAAARDAWSNADRFGGNTPPGKQARKRLAETGYGR